MSDWIITYIDIRKDDIVTCDDIINGLKNVKKWVYKKVQKGIIGIDDYVYLHNADQYPDIEKRVSVESLIKDVN